VKLGIMLPNTNNGFIMSRTSPQYRRLHDFLKGLVRGEHYGFRFAPLSLVKWRGFGGKIGFWDYALESLTLVARLAPVTERMQLFGSVGGPSIHPAVVAKMATTTQDAAHARFGLNGQGAALLRRLGHRGAPEDGVAGAAGRLRHDGAEDHPAPRRDVPGQRVDRGVPDAVAEKLNAFAEVPGLEGIMCCFEDYARDIEIFGQKVMPQIESFGARAG
jgi:alkanesulfonate monooxygenase SsuD/methylene tetrahydromethanopterin reductase-like flavin-dependent oxidoreductase (luciferase family)